MTLMSDLLPAHQTWKLQEYDLMMHKYFKVNSDKEASHR